MNQKDIWTKYITAQSKILDHKSKPIGIDNTKAIQFNGLKLILSIDQEIFKKVFKAEVEKVFKVTNFDFDIGYIIQDLAITETITEREFSKLKELSEICYIDFDQNPVIEGTITGKNSEIKDELKSIIGELPTSYQFRNSGLIYLTLDDWKKACEIQNLRFDKKVGAIFPIKPSISFLVSKISSFYKAINISSFAETIQVEGELHQDVYAYFHNHFGLEKYGNCLVFEFKDTDRLKRRVAELERKGIILPAPNNSTLRFIYTNKFYEEHETSLQFETFRLKRALNQHLEGLEFRFYYTTQYLTTEEVFWKKLYSEIHGEQFQISQTHRTISFDFETEEELADKLNYIRSFSYIDIYVRGEKHKYKFNLRFETGLHELQADLKKKYPSLFTKLIANGEKLIFRQFYQTGSKTEILARLRNELNAFIDSRNFNYTINDAFQEKYLCEENFDLKVEEEEEKLSKLLRKDFFFGHPKEKLNVGKFYLGKLQKVDYPELHLAVEEENLEAVKKNIASEAVKAIFPDLKGEKDKIKRLEDTVLKLESKEKLPNDNAKEFLYDSSKAKVIDNIEYLLNKSSAEWQDFENNLFSKSLNESQKKAIFKSLYAEELALIQGPPGTGKSTAIAEIIWQHIRREQKQRILLTSETNLAVDNAIDRLKSEQSNIVKPIRFGNVENLESEGYFYSLSAIEDWLNANETPGNAVAHWIENISKRVPTHNDENINSALTKWKKRLQYPNKGTKKMFADKYVQYANLIGATGSSIGKLNSENKWTSFFRSYQDVFKEQTISFDTIIMDEASKATPPELALPVVYGKKSIIVGDHRQLPPMVDGEEIKDLLVSIGEMALAKTLSQKEFETSQFERLFIHIDESIKGTFDTQYRMHPAINEAIAQFYKNDGGLNCGLPLEEPYHNSFNKWDSRYHGLSYKNIITRQTHTIWINVTAPEIQEGTSRVNFGEIEAIDKILTVIKNCDGKSEYDEWLKERTIEEKQIGLISFYGKQIKHLEKMLVESHSDLYKGRGKVNDKQNLIRLSTVDRFQGMERNIIIVSMVRSNTIASSKNQQPDFEMYGNAGYPIQESLGFAESPNRLNVALSRAKRLLIVVGNSLHFCKKEIYKNVFHTIQQNGKIISAEELQKAVERNG